MTRVWRQQSAVWVLEALARLRSSSSSSHCRALASRSVSVRRVKDFDYLHLHKYSIIEHNYVVCTVATISRYCAT